MSHACFSSSVSLTFRQTRLVRTPNSTQCSLAPDKPVISESSTQDQTTKHTYRVLPPNLPKSDRPPLPPRHKSVPFIGYFIEKALGIDTENYEKRETYGPIFNSSYLLGERTYIVDHALINDVMKNNELFTNAGALDTVASLFGYDAIIASDGDEHERLRSSVAPAFAPSLFPYYFNYVRRRVEKAWENVAKKAAVNDVIELNPEFPALYISIIVELTTGIDMDGVESERIRRCFKDIQAGIFTFQFGPTWNKAVSSRNEAMKVIANVVLENLATKADIIERLRERGEDLLKDGTKLIRSGDVNVLLILIANSSLSTEPNADNDNEVVMALCRMILSIWFGGYSTAAALSACTMFEIGMKDDIRSKLVAEQDVIVAAAGNDTTVTYQQTQADMPLFESFMMEMLRVHPPIGAMPRQAMKDVEILGHYVPEGSILSCDYYAAQRDAAIFSEPHTVKIDRFLKGSGEAKVASMISFGSPGSVHYCIGAAMAKMFVKTTFGTLLRDYVYTLKPGQSTEFTSLPECLPASGLLVDSFKRREK